MAEEGRFHRFQLSAEDVAAPSPEKARDTMVRCFREAQGQTFSWAARGTVKKGEDLEAVHAVRDMMAGIFLEMGVDFDRPTKDGLLKILRVCTDMARSWGTPEEVVMHNRREIQSLLDLL